MNHNFDFSGALKALELSAGDSGLHPEVGALLRALVASRPIGVFLELGTRFGLATAWMLDGMDEKSYLVSIVQDPSLEQTLKAHLTDNRLELRLGDATAILQSLPRKAFDLVLANTWAAENLEEILRRLVPGGFFVVTDIAPQSSEAQLLSQHPGLKVASLSLGKGLIVAVKTV